jgi:hypothetical protein
MDASGYWDKFERRREIWPSSPRSYQESINEDEPQRTKEWRLTLEDQDTNRVGRRDKETRADMEVSRGSRTIQEVDLVNVRPKIGFHFPSLVSLYGLQTDFISSSVSL